MANFQEEMSTQVKRLRDQVETFVHDKINPTVEKATARIKATVDTTSRLDALIALLVAKGVVTEEELKGHPGATTAAQAETVPPPTQDQV